MARIKKRGLDYFPLDTDFITHRTVRRLMKREGDGAVGILVWLFSCIYADKGYYLEVDDVLLEDIAADFYGFTDEDVRRVWRRRWTAESSTRDCTSDATS